jgi:hypothetical protein
VSICRRTKRLVPYRRNVDQFWQDFSGRHTNKSPLVAFIDVSAHGIASRTTRSSTRTSATSRVDLVWFRLRRLRKTEGKVLGSGFANTPLRDFRRPGSVSASNTLVSSNIRTNKKSFPTFGLGRNSPRTDASWFAGDFCWWCAGTSLAEEEGGSALKLRRAAGG